MYMLDLIIIVLAFIAGFLISYLIFPQELCMIERAVISAGFGIAISLIAIFSSSGFYGVKEVRYNLGLMAAIAVIVSGLQIVLSRLQVVAR